MTIREYRRRAKLREAREAFLTTNCPKAFKVLKRMGAVKIRRASERLMSLSDSPAMQLNVAARGGMSLTG